MKIFSLRHDVRLMREYLGSDKYSDNYFLYVDVQLGRMRWVATSPSFKAPNNESAVQILINAAKDPKFNPLKKIEVSRIQLSLF